MEQTINIPVEYKRLFDKDWREAAIYGGRFSGKSHAVARYLLIRARMSKIRVGCFREFQNSISDSSHQLLKDLIKQYQLNDFEVTDKSIVNTVTGSDFLFKGLWNNEQSIKSIEGIDIAWVEEAQTVTKESLDVLTPTIRKDNSQIIYTYNRLTEEDAVHNRLVIEGRPNTLVINVNYDIMLKNGLMPEVIRIEMEDDKLKRPNLYKTKWLGEPTVGEDAFFDRDALDRQVAMEPIRTSVQAKIFKEYNPSHRIAGGQDVAGGVGLDSSASVFIDFDTFPAQVILTYHSNKIRPADFGHEIARQGNLYGACLVAPENNKFDEAIGILKLVYPIGRIYTTKNSENKIFNTSLSTFGWNTNGLTKSKMLNDLGSAIEDGLISLNDKDLINEAKAYSRNHLLDRDIDVRKVTKHFDLLMACAIAWQMKDYAVRASARKELNTIDKLFIKAKKDEGGSSFE